MTPSRHDKRPDFTPRQKASQTVGRVLKQGDVVIYESTKCTGVTEEVCVPELERASNQKFNHGFTVGYSPERINPGDKERRLATIPKVTSGSTPEALPTSWMHFIVSLLPPARIRPAALKWLKPLGDRKYPARRQHRAYQ